MWAHRPSTIARCLDETTEKSQILSTDSVQSTYMGVKQQGRYKVRMMKMKRGWTTEQTVDMRDL